MVGGSIIVVGLGLYALKLINAVRVQEVQRARCLVEARDSVFILIASYIDDQVDRSECVLRIRVLLDAHFIDWPRARFRHFEQVSDAILSQPFGDARRRLDDQLRRTYDSRRRQLLQIHEDALALELRKLKEWLKE